MPPGDAQRTWFPEMIEALRTRWQPNFSIEQVIALRNDLDRQLQSIRRSRTIAPAMMSCPKCGVRAHAAPPKVSVRATILALRRFGIADEATVRVLERQWKSFRAKHSLDGYGGDSLRSEVG
jgi:hypothetical protein